MTLPHDLTDTQEMLLLREENQRLRDRLLDMLRAPYERMLPWATTASCQELGHPVVRNDGKTCACGSVS